MSRWTVEELIRELEDAEPEAPVVVELNTDNKRYPEFVVDTPLDPEDVEDPEDGEFTIRVFVQ